MPASKTKKKPSSRPAARGPARAGSHKANSRRVSYLYLPWSPYRRLKVSVRKFNTNPNRRSKKQRQFVVILNSQTVKEVAFKFEKRPKRRAVAKQSISFSYRPLAISMILILLGIGGAVFSITHIRHSVRLDLSPSAKASASGVFIPKDVLTPKVMPRAMPRQIRIPAIGVDASIVSVGLNQQGAIAMPDSVDVGAWYNGSPTPGQLGPAIIAGHVDNYYQGDGAFFPLRNTQVGDMIYIDRADGTTATFKVADIKQVPQANFPTQEVFGNINYAGLRVITCGGAFNHQTYEYEDNIVVFAILQ